MRSISGIGQETGSRNRVMTSRCFQATCIDLHQETFWLNFITPKMSSVSETSVSNVSNDKHRRK